MTNHDEIVAMKPVRLRGMSVLTGRVPGLDNYTYRCKYYS